MEHIVTSAQWAGLYRTSAGEDIKMSNDGRAKEIVAKLLLWQKFCLKNWKLFCNIIFSFQILQNAIIGRKGGSGSANATTAASSVTLNCISIESPLAAYLERLQKCPQNKRKLSQFWSVWFNTAFSRVWTIKQTNEKKNWHSLFFGKATKFHNKSYWSFGSLG